jgi:hypothetical protein
MLLRMKITGDKGPKSLIRGANIFSRVIILHIVKIKNAAERGVQTADKRDTVE